MITVPINGQGGTISIDVMSYENPTAKDTSDANWLSSRIEVTAGPFSGRFNATLTTQDFVCFRDEMEALLNQLKGKATFQTDEDWLGFHIEMQTRGTAKVTGIAKVHGEPKASLSFAFETDQSLLAQTKSALDAVVEKFPIKL